MKTPLHARPKHVCESFKLTYRSRTPAEKFLSAKMGWNLDWLPVLIQSWQRRMPVARSKWMDFSPAEKSFVRKLIKRLKIRKSRIAITAIVRLIKYELLRSILTGSVLVVWQRRYRRLNFLNWLGHSGLTRCSTSTRARRPVATERCSSSTFGPVPENPGHRFPRWPWNSGCRLGSVPTVGSAVELLPRFLRVTAIGKQIWRRRWEFVDDDDDLASSLPFWPKDNSCRLKLKIN